MAMQERKMSKLSILAVSVGYLWLFGGIAEAADINVDCSTTTISDALSNANSGDTLLVSGTCNETVRVRTSRLTLDGQGIATIDGGSSTSATVSITRRGVTIIGFTITGGGNGISVSSAATVVIDNNIIDSTGNHGISVSRGSSVRIVDNMIQNNQNSGIFINENSTARIGLFSTSDAAPSPNTIQNNGADGIQGTRSSNLRIVGNTIQNNGDDGVDIRKASHADIASNTIDGNGDEGIEVSENSGVNLGDNPDDPFDEPNETSVNNVNVSAGIKCRTGGYANGSLGTLNGGVDGATNFSNSCIDSLN